MIPSHERHPFESFNPRNREGLVLRSRRNMLKAGLAGIAGLTVPGLLRERSWAQEQGRSINDRKSVILLWMAGGPSHIDTLDPKPDRPLNNRGPFGVIRTRQPGVLICDRLPQLASMLDRFTILRAVDCRHSNHEPNTVMQTANLAAEARTNPEATMYPAIASVVARHRGVPGIPPYVAFQKSRSHLAYGGYLGRQYDPFLANFATRLPVYDSTGNDTGQVTNSDLFTLARGLTHESIHERRSLLREFDRVRRDIDTSGAMESMDRFNQQAVDMMLGGRVRDAFDHSRESAAIRDRYGRHLWCQQALIARRTVATSGANRRSSHVGSLRQESDS